MPVEWRRDEWGRFRGDREPVRPERAETARCLAVKRNGQQCKVWTYTPYCPAHACSARGCQERGWLVEVEYGTFRPFCDRHRPGAG